MAERKTKGKSARLVGPLRESGRMSGPAAGVPEAPSPADPLGYTTQTGGTAPGGSMSQHEAQNTGHGGKDQSP